MALQAREVHAAIAALPKHDDAPRVIQQFTSVFLVSRSGELWRVYDCDAPDGSVRRMPSALSARRARAFVALARTPEVRIHGFALDETRDVSPQALQHQLDKSIALS
jgi:hypothetical protein